MSAVRNAPGASITATSCSYAASNAAVMRTNSVAAIGEVTMDLFIFYFLFILLQLRGLLFFRFFLFQNISIHSAPFFCLFVSCSPWIRWNITLSCICLISDLVAFIPLLPNIFSPCFRFSCLKTWTMRFV